MKINWRKGSRPRRPWQSSSAPKACKVIVQAGEAMSNDVVSVAYEGSATELQHQLFPANQDELLPL